MIRRIEEHELLYSSIQEIATRHDLHERMRIPLFHAALDMKTTSPNYKKNTEVSTYVAGQDLEILTKKLLIPHGQKRGRYYRYYRYYTAGEEIEITGERAKLPPTIGDPYDLPEVKIAMNGAGR